MFDTPTFPEKKAKKPKKTSRFKNWFKITFCTRTSNQTTDIEIDRNTLTVQRELTESSWKDALDHQLESQFAQAGTQVPNYVLRAH